MESIIELLSPREALLRELLARECALSPAVPPLAVVAFQIIVQIPAPKFETGRLRSDRVATLGRGEFAVEKGDLGA
jgi:hypothetical protein